MYEGYRDTAQPYIHIGEHWGDNTKIISTSPDLKTSIQKSCSPVRVVSAGCMLCMCQALRLHFVTVAYMYFLLFKAYCVGGSKCVALPLYAVKYTRTMALFISPRMWLGQYEYCRAALAPWDLPYKLCLSNVTVSMNTFIDGCHGCFLAVLTSNLIASFVRTHSPTIDSRGGGKGIGNACIHILHGDVTSSYNPCYVIQSRVRANSRACQGGRSEQGISCCSVSGIFRRGWSWDILLK